MAAFIMASTSHNEHIQKTNTQHTERVELQQQTNIYSMFEQYIDKISNIPQTDMQPAHHSAALAKAIQGYSYGSAATGWPWRLALDRVV